MKLLITTVAAMALTGSAYAYQTTPTMDVDMNATTTAMTPGVDVSIDPNVAITPPANWTPEQRTLYEQHLDFHPTTWTEQQRAQFQAMRGIPPVSWTPEQRLLYQEHIVSLPTSWTPEQRVAYERQIATFRMPWAATTVTAAAATAVPQPDYRTFAGMGGPYEEAYGTGGVSLTPRPASENYPPCDPGPGDDNCIQLYEPGVRDNLAGWTGSSGGALDARSSTGMGGPLEATATTTRTTSPATTTTRWSTTDPTGTTPNDPVDTQGSGLIEESPTGIDADHAEEHDH